MFSKKGLKLNRYKEQKPKTSSKVHYQIEQDVKVLKTLIILLQKWLRFSRIFKSIKKIKWRKRKSVGENFMSLWTEDIIRKQ